MNRKEFIGRIAAETGFTKKDITVVEAAFEKCVMDILKEGGEVILNNFIKFYTEEVPEKTGTIMFGKNKGEQWVKPAHNAPKIKPSSTFKKCCE